METSLKTGLPKFSLAAQKFWVAQTLGGAAAPLPPRPVRLWSQNQVHVCQRDDTSQLESCDQDNSNFGYNGSIIARREEDINLRRGVAEGADSNADQNQFEEPAPEEEKEEISNPWPIVQYYRFSRTPITLPTLSYGLFFSLYFCLE